MQPLFRQIQDGLRLTHGQAVELSRSASTDELCALASDLRLHFRGRNMDTCSILNARSGLCGEDCKWCSQSRHHATAVETYPLVSAQQALDAAAKHKSDGVKRFSLVTSGRKVSGADFEKICAIYRKLETTGMGLCASLGLLDEAQMRALKAAGVERYHCNLESAPSYFPQLCTTHTTEEKIATLKAARNAGLALCSGGIIGMGESMDQRIELAVTLRDLGVRSVPLNILNPIKGTPLEAARPLTQDEILRTFALFRIINPEADLRMAGGRVAAYDYLGELIDAGVSASIVGDMLTTVGSKAADDMQMFRSKGLIV